MGMYDTVYCDMPLPDGYNADGQASFQTKDLGRNLDELRITADGLLMMETQFRDETAQPHDTGHSGTLRFYGIEGDVNADHHLWLWHEYRAEFADGRCQEIRLVRSVTGAELHSPAGPDGAREQPRTEPD